LHNIISIFAINNQPTTDNIQ